MEWMVVVGAVYIKEDLKRNVDTQKVDHHDDIVDVVGKVKGSCIFRWHGLTRQCRTVRDSRATPHIYIAGMRARVFIG